MKCRFCDNTLPDNAAFCPFCAASIRPTPSQAGSVATPPVAKATAKKAPASVRAARDRFRAPSMPAFDQPTWQDMPGLEAAKDALHTTPPASAPPVREPAHGPDASRPYTDTASSQPKANAPAASPQPKADAPAASPAMDAPAVDLKAHPLTAAFRAPEEVAKHAPLHAPPARSPVDAGATPTPPVREPAHGPDASGPYTDTASPQPKAPAAPDTPIPSPPAGLSDLPELEDLLSGAPDLARDPEAALNDALRALDTASAVGEPRVAAKHRRSSHSKGKGKAGRAKGKAGRAKGKAGRAKGKAKQQDSPIDFGRHAAGKDAPSDPAQPKRDTSTPRGRRSSTKGKRDKRSGRTRIQVDLPEDHRGTLDLGLSAKARRGRHDAAAALPDQDAPLTRAFADAPAASPKASPFRKPATTLKDTPVDAVPHSPAQMAAALEQANRAQAATPAADALEEILQELPTPPAPQQDPDPRPPNILQRAAQKLPHTPGGKRRRKKGGAQFGWGSIALLALGTLLLVGGAVWLFVSLSRPAPTPAPAASAATAATPAPVAATELPADVKALVNASFAEITQALGSDYTALSLPTATGGSYYGMQYRQPDVVVVYDSQQQPADSAHPYYITLGDASAVDGVRPGMTFTQVIGVLGTTSINRSGGVTDEDAGDQTLYSVSYKKNAYYIHVLSTQADGANSQVILSVDG